MCGKPAKVYGKNMVGCTDNVHCTVIVDFGHYDGLDEVIAAWNKRTAGVTKDRLAFHAWASKNVQPCELSGYQGPSGEWLYDNTIVELCWQAWRAEVIVAAIDEVFVLRELLREALNEHNHSLDEGGPGDLQERITAALAGTVEPSVLYVEEINLHEHTPRCAGMCVPVQRVNRQAEPSREFTATEAESFSKAFAKSPRRVNLSDSDVSRVSVYGDQVHLVTGVKCPDCSQEFTRVDANTWEHRCAVNRE
jgi:hypothetical protein